VAQRFQVLTEASTPQWEPGLHIEQMIGRTSAPVEGPEVFSSRDRLSFSAYRSFINQLGIEPILGVSQLYLFFTSWSLMEVAENGMNDRCGLLVNASRSIIYADGTNRFHEAAREQAAMLQDQMEILLKDRGLI